MPNITLRDIPTELHKKLRAEAEVHGRSLNKEILLRLKVSLMQRPARSASEILAASDRVRRRLKGVWLDDATLEAARREGRP
jgi:plasmid stability protein